MASRFASLTSEENIQINFFVVYIISLFEYILKQLFTSVSVASVGYLFSSVAVASVGYLPHRFAGL